MAGIISLLWAGVRNQDGPQFAFAVSVLVSTAPSACDGNNDFSTATLCIHVLLLAAIGFNLFLYFFL